MEKRYQIVEKKATKKYQTQVKVSPYFLAAFVIVQAFIRGVRVVGDKLVRRPNLSPSIPPARVRFMGEKPPWET